MRKIQPILLSPYFIALLIIVLVILFVPFRFTRHSLTLEDYGSADKKGGWIQCCDLDNDGTSELIIEFDNILGNVAFKAFHSDWSVIDQWNFNGKRSKEGTVIRDFRFNQDSLTYLAAFYNRDDSVFLAVLQPWPENRQLVDDIFITTVQKRNDTIDYNIPRVVASDLTGDGTGDLVFCIVAGFSRIPRSVFVYDMVEDTVLRSESYGFGINGLELNDLDKDGKDEIIINSTSRGNIPDSLGIPYSDYSSYIAVYDDNLELMFDPLEDKNFPSFARSWVEEDKNGDKTISGIFIPGSGSKEYIYFYRLDIEGNVIEKDSLVAEFVSQGTNVDKIRHREKEYYFFFTKTGRAFWADKDMEIVRTARQEVVKVGSWSTTDINNDHKQEHIFLTGLNSDRLLVTDFWMDESAMLDLPGVSEYPYRRSIQVMQDRNAGHRLLIQVENYWYIVRYVSKPYFFFQYTIYLAIYLAILFFILFILKIQRNQLERKYETEKRQAELQLMTIKGQIDPHFTFNAMNSIGAVIFKEDRKTAYSYFTKFSRLIRLALESSDKLSRSLQEEIDFVNLYLDLEKFRFKNKINYSINIGDEVNTSMSVPRMIIQTFVENAIKHGLMHKEEGFLQLDIHQDKELMIIIKDNGIGLQNAAKVDNRSTGKGLNIMDQILDLYHKVNGVQIRYELKEIFLEGKSQGTKVIITIPV